MRQRKATGSLVLLVSETRPLGATLAQSLWPRALIRPLDGRRCVDKQALLGQCASTLGFPDYFGRNWDALEECLNDLSWLPRRSVGLLVLDAVMICPNHDHDFATFIAILRGATANDQDQASDPDASDLTHLDAALHAESSQIKQLSDRLELAGLSGLPQLP
jgi:RNAse (barnase) inhibitor barstar